METLIELVDGPLAGERRRVYGMWGTHVIFSAAGRQYSYKTDGTFAYELSDSCDCLPYHKIGCPQYAPTWAARRQSPEPVCECMGGEPCDCPDCDCPDCSYRLSEDR